jgi:hypothetical protein
MKRQFQLDDDYAQTLKSWFAKWQCATANKHIHPAGDEPEICGLKPDANGGSTG